MADAVYGLMYDLEVENVQCQTNAVDTFGSNRNWGKIKKNFKKRKSKKKPNKFEKNMHLRENRTRDFIVSSHVH